MNFKKMVAFFIATTVYFTTFPQFTDTTTILPEPYLNNMYEHFGYRVAVDGDYAVVTAPGYWDWSGYAVLLHYNGTAWEIVKEIYPGFNRIDNNFGHSVAIDGNIIAIGIPGDGGIGTVSLYEIVDYGDSIGVSYLGTLYPSDFDSGIHFGYSLAMDDSIIVVGTNSYGNKAKPVYVFVRPQNGWQTMSESFTLHASDQLASDNFGISVDVKNGIIAVGAPLKDVDSAADAGVVYIFDISNGFQTDTQTATILPPVIWDDGNFGSDVALSENYLLVGASRVDNFGRAYVFGASVSDGWAGPQLLAELKPATDQLFSYFGNSVDLEDSVAIVASYRRDENYEDQGVIYIFEPASGWSDMNETAVLTASDASSSDQLGESVCIQGNRIFAGASQKTLQFKNEGKLYFYAKNGTNWSDANETQGIDPPVHLSNAYDLFGSSVAKCGDILAVGAPGYHAEQGRVFLYQRNKSGWIKIAELRASDTSAVYRFGDKVAMSQDLIVVSAPSSGRGKVFLFEKPAGGWTDMVETARLSPADASHCVIFGSSVDIYGDTIAVGDFSYYNFGKVFIFEKPSGGWSGTVNETASFYGGDYGANYRGMWGVSVKLSENMLFIGVPQDVMNPYHTGTVRVFAKSPSQNWADLSQVALLMTNDPTPDQWLGFSLDYENGILVAGATYDSYRRGAVYVFSEPQDGWSDTVVAIVKISPQGLSTYDYFGYKVAIKDTMIFASSYYYNYGMASTGAVFVYSSGGDWTSVDSLTVLGPDNSNFLQLYGSAMQVDGNSLIVGAPGTTQNGYKSGAVFIYEYPSINTAVAHRQELEFYPNPVKDYVIVNALHGEIIIYDISGNAVKKVKATGQYPAINVSDLAPGIYVIKLRSGKNVTSSKFVKL